MSKTISKLKSIVGSALMLFAVVIAALPATATAAAGNPSYCDSQIDRLTNQNIGTEVPVIMVHGMGNYKANANVWGSVGSTSSFAGRVDRIPGVAVAHLFHYDTSVWVDEDSGPMLAKTIDCVSRLSTHKGGKGKVIVVGYSLGGLVARDALSRRSTDGQRAIADEVGQVITIGSPHVGANVWTWSVYNPGSPELARLPHFPASTPVHTIAGDVTRVYYNDKKQEVRREQPYDDTLVSTLSANAEYTIDVNKGGGSTTVSCEKKFDPKGPWGIFGYKDRGPASCEHGQLIQNASNGVREDTIAAIQKYVAWLNAPPVPSSKTLTVGPLTTTYDSRWKNAEYGASGPGQDLSADDTTNGAACTNCDDTPPPTINAFIQVGNLADWCTESIQLCAIGPSEVIGTAPAVTIGGKTPSYSARFLDSGYQGGSMVWCFETEKVCVYYRRAVDTPQLEMSAALLDVFTSATWSN